MRLRSKTILNKQLVGAKPTRSKSATKPAISKRRQQNRLIIVIAALVVVAAVVFLLICSGVFITAPKQISVTIAWNPGSTADDIVRTISRATSTQVSLLNITGANGANGANAVFSSERDSKTLLSTHLSAFVTSEAMGFADSSPSDWAAWICAFSPAVVVVASDSPYHSMSDLIAAMREKPGELQCANSGFGTVSFTAAELLSTRVILEFDHISLSGSSQAVDALRDNEDSDFVADFAVLLSIDVAENLRAGELRAIGVFGSEDYVLYNDNIAITVPPIEDVGNRLNAVLPFGEYFGLFIPADTPQSSLRKLDILMKKAVNSEVFEEYSKKAGLIIPAPDRAKSTEIIERYSSIICWTLYDVRYLPTNPETLGISRP